MNQFNFQKWDGKEWKDLPTVKSKHPSGTYLIDPSAGMPGQLEETLNWLMYWGLKYELQYKDYDENQWTVPVLLNPERIERIISDHSVKKIRVIS